VEADTVSSIASVVHLGHVTAVISGEPVASTGAGRFPPRTGPEWLIPP
jgi:hypothetical protein